MSATDEMMQRYKEVRKRLYKPLSGVEEPQPTQVITPSSYARVSIVEEKKQYSGPITFNYILHTVCEYYNIGPLDLRGGCKKLHMVLPRWMVCYLSKKHTALSSNQIGLRIHRDHSTVLYAIKRFREALHRDPQLQADIMAVEGILRGDRDRPAGAGERQ